MSEKLIIIGSGPAAWTAAIYAARANLNPLVIEGAMIEENRLTNTLPGGQLSLTTEVENYPGFPDGVDGPHLVHQMRRQAEKYGTRIITEDVKEVSTIGRGDLFGVFYGDDKVEVNTNSVIVSTGASAKYLGVPGEEEYKNRGVSACAVCDGALPRFRDQPVAVIGGGDTACEEANYLSKFASKVYLIHRRDKLRASKAMADRVLSNPKVKPLWNMKVERIGGSDEDGVRWVKCVPTDYDTDSDLSLIYKNIDVTGVFCAIGHQPNTRFLKTKTGTEVDWIGVLVDEWGYIVTGRDYGWSKGFSTNTNVEGMFAAGDVADPTYRQAITAAGSGCKAALDVERYLAQKGIH